ncbi:DUF6273 domain-containing protein [Lactococcus formosensis]|uniref:DUF6273 domain-containing protein n=1 Tax=Lactococcus formosensis TaxID=1281486 RepID=A0A9Q9D6H1_9LACT|nr:DUF6273 domain-containing protein [Lactococcus formosensis]USJ20185.1 DUF6273 domain-containing protein [Lactococcus formosensis]
MKSKKKMMMFLGLSLLQILIAVFIVVKREDFIYLLPAKEPQVLRDLAYDKDKRLGYTIHIKEEGKLVPYLVLTKNYINQGNVLLLRKYLLDPPMSFRDGWEEAYYGHSIPDAFMHKDFIKRLAKGIQENIPLTELGIKPSEENAGMGHIEKIKRKLFLLSDIDVGNYKGRVRFEDDRNLMYFKRKGGVKEDRLAYLEGDSTPYSWWLRTAFATASTVVSAVNYEGMLSGGGVVYPAHVRPAFTLPPEIEVEEKVINGNKEYVLKIDK